MSWKLCRCFYVLSYNHRSPARWPSRSMVKGAMASAFSGAMSLSSSKACSPSLLTCHPAIHSTFQVPPDCNHTIVARVIGHQTTVWLSLQMAAVALRAGSRPAGGSMGLPPPLSAVLLPSGVGFDECTFETSNSPPTWGSSILGSLGALHNHCAGEMSTVCTVEVQGLCTNREPWAGPRNAG